MIITQSAERRPAALVGRVLLLVPLLALWAPGQPERDASPEPSEPAAIAPVERLGWLAGCWEGTLSSGAVYEETWLAPRGGVLVGVARMTRDGRALSFEFMRIFDEQGTLVYAAQPSGRPPTLFRATAVASDDVTFENPEHDFPQRIRYRFVPPDALHARIEGERDGQLRGMDFPLRRTACPSAAEG
jgi:hypothetical protein